MTSLMWFSLAIMAGEPMPTNTLPVNQPSTVVEANMLVERAKQEIAQEEKLWSEETAREKESESRRRTRFSDFSQDRIRLQETIAGQEENLKASLAKMEGHQFKERELQSRFTQLSQTLSAKAQQLREAMAPGLPYRMDKRLEALDLLVRDIAGASISPEEAMNRLWSIEQNERRLAQEAEVFSGDFAADAGDPIQVKYLRVGKQLLAFSSLDGTKLGILKSAVPPAQGYIWVREKELDHNTRQALKQAIATAEGKALPGFVAMPIWNTAFASTSSEMVAPADTEMPVKAKGSLK